MMETLAVIVFCAGIFTFLYVSVLPLIGTYNDLVIRENNIDIVYKLYNIRLAIQKDNKLKDTLTNNSFKNIVCSDFKDEDYCNNLMTQMELTNYDLFYTDSIKNNIEGFSSYKEVYDYLKKHKEEDNPTLVLIDNKEHTIAHLDYYEINPSVSMADVILKKVPKTGTCSNIIYTDPEDGIKYFSGTNDCVNFNYVWYSGKLWRITAIYPDGAMKLVTENNITSISFNEYGNVNFENSYMYNWLNEEFYDTLYRASEFIDTTKRWNATMLSAVSIKPEETNMVSSNVGLLNYYEYYNSYRCISSAACTGSSYYSTSYLNIGYYWWLLNPHDGASYVKNVFNSGSAGSSSPTVTCGVRPSIYLKSGLEFTGNGTTSDPYKIVGDKDAGSVNDLVNTRLSGEYVKLKSGNNEQLFRIISVEDNKTKIIALDYANNKDRKYYDHVTGTYNLWGSGTTTGENTWYTYLNDEYLPNLKTTYGELFDSNLYYLGSDGQMYDKNYKLSVCANTTSGNTKVCDKTSDNGIFEVGLPRYGEMFATHQSGGFNKSINMWLMNIYSSWWIWGIEAQGVGKNFERTQLEAARPTLHLKSTVKIKSGSGTEKDPYVVGL